MKILKIVLSVCAFLVALIYVRGQYDQHTAGSDLKLVIFDEIGTTVIDPQMDTDSFIQEFDSRFSQESACSGLSLVHWHRSLNKGRQNTGADYDAMHRAAWRIEFYHPMGGNFSWDVDRNESIAHSHTWVKGRADSVEDATRAVCRVIQGRGGSLTN